VRVCRPTKTKGTEGAVFVEFLIAFLPVLTLFLCLVQLALLFAVKLLVEHAAVNCARTAAVVIGDDPKAYSGQVEALHELKPAACNGQSGGARFRMVCRAALLTLGAFIADGTIRDVVIEFPPSNTPGGKNQSTPKWSPMNGGTIDKVRVRVRARAACKIGLANRIACGGLQSFTPTALLQGPEHWVQAEAVYPYQGASYAYQ